jgi:hypothetical protein
VTQTARLNFDSDLSLARLRNLTLDEFKWSAGTRDLNGTHFRHINPPEIRLQHKLTPYLAWHTMTPIFIFRS